MTGQWGFWDQFCWYSALPQCLGSNDRLDIVIQTITGSAVDVAHFAIAFALAPLPEKQHLPQGKVEILHSIYTSCKLCLHVAAFPQSGCGREAPEKEVKSVTYLEWHIWSQHNILAKSNGHFQASKSSVVQYSTKIPGLTFDSCNQGFCLFRWCWDAFDRSISAGLPYGSFCPATSLELRLQDVTQAEMSLSLELFFNVFNSIICFGLF